ncbi:hypothetical protein TREMEDRAFT_60737 [Tremella mesenterica DSM 1558]|uniref:uncharacterized protein n=1 Tax=Tremella mesenterica (strain ATCC 24925 / CBS 8224 / DSM 1558 / NBRC 9311 / NRRL Y-6157 / RJB 2259-6 / UBC 559-6) TaxID=578456 RepID=UPI0003F4990F|nr:uncharacterized protein TREMEDRAFT_60737 [Tremella mesenterica DSM 1558]EIW71819.1 hypothetical protein TREMEDRAFT_60737 [Tremella mesenterica DSM 1558]
MIFVVYDEGVEGVVLWRLSQEIRNQSPWEKRKIHGVADLHDALEEQSQARNTGVNLKSRANTITSITQAIDCQWKEGHPFWDSPTWCWPEGEGLVGAATCFQQYHKQLQPRDQYDYRGQYKLSLLDSIIQNLSEVHNQVTKELDARLVLQEDINPSETERVKKSLFHGDPWGTFFNRQQTLKNCLKDPNVNAETIGKAFSEFLEIAYKAVHPPWAVN